GFEDVFVVERRSLHADFHLAWPRHPTLYGVILQAVEPPRHADDEFYRLLCRGRQRFHRLHGISSTLQAMEERNTTPKGDLRFGRCCQHVLEHQGNVQGSVLLPRLMLEVQQLARYAGILVADHPPEAP